MPDRRPNPISPSLRSFGLTSILRLVFRHARSRPALRDMEPRLLADIGVTREQAMAEADRAPWEIGPAEAPWSLRELISRWHGRRLLPRLDARAIKDLGRGYAELDAEANKPFWRS